MPHALSIQKLRKVYANGLVAIDDLSLDIEEGDFFALLGPNGAGKSTAIGIISSLIRKTSGTVRILGLDIETDFSKARKLIGFVPQEFNFNVFEPIVEILANQAGYYGIPRRRAFAQAEFYLEKLGLWEKRKDGARLLSGGMKRRLVIARALVHEPRLLILDEPTAGVDIEIRYSMWSYLRELNAQGTTIILTTHYLEEAENLCRHIGILHQGRLVEDTSMKELLTRLHQETLVLELTQVLPQALQIPGFFLRSVDEQTIEVEVSRDQTINDLFKALETRGITVMSIKNKSNRLEQVFLNLVKDKRVVEPRT